MAGAKGPGLHFDNHVAEFIHAQVPSLVPVLDFNHTQCQWFCELEPKINSTCILQIQPMAIEATHQTTRRILSEEPGQVSGLEAMPFQALPRPGHEQNTISILGGAVTPGLLDLLCTAVVLVR